jgi:hypothetical protein
MLSEGILWVMFFSGVAAKKHNPRHISDKSCVHTKKFISDKFSPFIVVLKLPERGKNDQSTTHLARVEHCNI